jgi:hypothetical protein
LQSYGKKSYFTTLLKRILGRNKKKIYLCIALTKNKVNDNEKKNWIAAPHTTIRVGYTGADKL